MLSCSCGERRLVEHSRLFEAAEALGAEVMRYIYTEQKTAQNLNFPDLHPAANAGQTIDGDARRPAP